MKPSFKLLWVLAAVVCTLASPLLAVSWFVPVDFSSSHRGRIQGRNASFPEGNVVLGGVPFEIPVGGNNEWHSGNGGGSGGDGQWILNIDVNVFGVQTAYTLIDTYWGTIQPGRMLVEFFGSDGAYYQRDLIGNSDIRDWNLYPIWTTKINGVTAVNVVYVPVGMNNNPDVMDMQIYELSSDFYDETLENIRITDNRTTFVHSGIVSGVTVEVIPEPLTMFGVALGVAGLAGYIRRRL